MMKYRLTKKDFTGGFTVTYDEDNESLIELKNTFKYKGQKPDHSQMMSFLQLVPFSQRDLWKIEKDFNIKKMEVNKKTENKELYHRFCQLYNQMVYKHTGMPADWTTAPQAYGTGIHKIIQYLLHSSKEKLGHRATLSEIDTQALQAWEYILNHWEVIQREDEFLTRQIKPMQIASNLSSIIMILRNEARKSTPNQGISSQSKLDDLYG
ncbi:hypothetical protein MY04_4779 [Flammeovirga sp. MY04]|uniref:hypothetical protein n=1 Tax=Flammeovirga sp. MY04 TaxID=1191459 RepID=UPI0008062A2C|nr:hypothetical protein [Flammeovirga sp. MY04]ANQ49596.1 hypothetical protein MY04_2222 [Flammeovirga sp. MY04]ANQ52114.1 hypothetical protein MY04_4779 [Flammeovirga sp. MY04]